MKLNPSEILDIAIKQVNNGCTFPYVTTGLREWFGVDLKPESLYSLVKNSPKLLSPSEITDNAWHNIITVDTNNMRDIDRFYLYWKYGYDWKQLDRIFAAYREGVELGRQEIQREQAKNTEKKCDTIQLESERAIEEGRHQAAVDAAAAMLSDDCSVDIIQHYTGLSIEEITEIQKSQENKENED